MGFGIRTRIPVSDWQVAGLNISGGLKHNPVVNIVPPGCHSPLPGAVKSRLDLDMPFLRGMGGGVHGSDPIDVTIVEPIPAARRHGWSAAPVRGVQRLGVRDTAPVRIVLISAGVAELVGD